MKIKRIGIKCGCIVDFSIFGCDLFKRTSKAMLEAKVVKTVVAADYRIMKLAENGDLIITQDYGLASLGLAKGCTVLHHSGYSYTNENIDQLLQTRYLSAMARKSGKRTKGPKPFTSEDREKFRGLFKRTISR